MSTEFGTHLFGSMQEQGVTNNLLHTRHDPGEAVHKYVPQNASYIDEFTRGLLGVHITLDLLLSRILWSVLGLICIIVLISRWAQMSHQYIRLAASSEASLRNQRYWGTEWNTWWAWSKRHILYAPLVGKRHNRELTLSKAVNVGVIPSRLHTTLITLYILLQVAYCCILSYKSNDKAALIAELRGRSGSLSLLNMIPLFIFAGRNNPLIGVLKVSFDTFNLYHRWLGRIAAAEAIIHTCAWATNAVGGGGWAHMFWRAFTEPFFLTGSIGTIAMVILLIHSPSPIRHAFYETFLTIHQIMALIVVVVVWIHLKIDALPQLPFYWFIPTFWACERLIRVARILYMNVSRCQGLTKVTFEALPQQATRVTFELPKNRKIPAGSHVYAYFPRFSFWMNHPFSVAWAENDADSVLHASIVTKANSESSSSTALPRSLTVKANQRLGEHGRRHFDRRISEGGSRIASSVTSSWFIKPAEEDLEHTRVSLIIAARTGLTKKIYDAALSRPSGTLQCHGFIEGPYCSHPTSFNSYGTVILFSGGAGITHHLLHARNLIYEINAGMAATRQVHLIWTVRSMECFSWVTPFMNQILSIPRRKHYLKCKLYVSRPDGSEELRNLSSSVEMLSGRCKPGGILDEVMDRQVTGEGAGAVAVSVCGPGAFADEVRHEVRSRIGQGVMLDLTEEAFSW